MEWLAGYLAIGALVGVCAGLLGIGGGAIMVPLLVSLFEAQGVEREHVLHLAVGSSMATILFTSLSSVRSHAARGALRWDIVRAITPGILAGGLAGSAVASRIPTALFAVLFYLPAPFNSGLCAFLFLFASFTDFFDGHLARKWQVTSRIGQMLDPIADKMLVAVALVLLVSVERAPMAPVLIILCRELFISGLREFMAGRKTVIKVSQLAKWKTAIQMLAVFLLLLGAKLPGGIALWAAAALTAFTGWQYFRACLPMLKE